MGSFNSMSRFEGWPQDLKDYFGGRLSRVLQLLRGHGAYHLKKLTGPVCQKSRVWNP